VVRAGTRGLADEPSGAPGTTNRSPRRVAKARTAGRPRRKAVTAPTLRPAGAAGGSRWQSRRAPWTIAGLARPAAQQEHGRAPV